MALFSDYTASRPQTSVLRGIGAEREFAASGDRNSRASRRHAAGVAGGAAKDGAEEAVIERMESLRDPAFGDDCDMSVGSTGDSWD